MKKVICIKKITNFIQSKKRKQMKRKMMHFGDVDADGKLTLAQRRTFKLELKTFFAGKRIRILIEEASKQRSINQNDYYRAVIVPRYTYALNRLGWRFTDPESHDYIGKKFLQETSVNQITGEVFTRTRSTADLSTVEFNEFIDACIAWAAEDLEEIIPYPNEK